MKRFVKKPVEIIAIQYNNLNKEEIEIFILARILFLKTPTMRWSKILLYF